MNLALTTQTCLLIWSEDNKMIEQVIVKASSAYPLDGILTFPDFPTPKVPAVVLVHGSGALDKDETIGATKLFRDIADGLAEKGIASLRYDKRTIIYGKQMVSELKGGITVEEEVVQDAIFAANLLKEDPRIDKERVFVIGHSLGGMLAPRIDAEGGDFAGLIIMAGTIRNLDEVIIDQNEDALSQLDEAAKDAVSIQIKALKDVFDSVTDMSIEKAQQTILVGNVYAWYLKEMKQHPVRDYLEQMNKPIFILQGDGDVQVSTDKDFNKYKEILKYNPRATFKLYSGLNHLFMKAIYGTIIDVLKEYDVPQTVSSSVLEDIAEWIFTI